MELVPWADCSDWSPFLSGTTPVAQVVYAEYTCFPFYIVIMRQILQQLKNKKPYSKKSKLIVALEIWLLFFIWNLVFLFVPLSKVNLIFLTYVIPFFFLILGQFFLLFSVFFLPFCRKGTCAKLWLYTLCMFVYYTFFKKKLG